jgi:hypothetical protein
MDDPAFLAGQVEYGLRLLRHNRVKGIFRGTFQVITPIAA